VLLKQDKTEALMSVNGRLEFIEKEIKRIEAQIKGIQEKSEKLKVEVGYPLWYYKSNGTDTSFRLSRYKTPHSSSSSSKHKCQHRSVLREDRPEAKYDTHFDSI
jgi:tRNA G10  N-methylase Trm11